MIRHHNKEDDSLGSWGAVNFARFDLGATGHGFYWDGNCMANGSLRRLYAGPLNRTTCYTMSSCISTAIPATKTYGRLIPDIADLTVYLQKLWGANYDPYLDDEVHSVFCHASGGGYTAGNRKGMWTNTIAPRQDTATYLDFLFGNADGSLIDANGDRCWFATHYLDKFPNVSYFGHDTTATVWPSGTLEYAVAGAAQDAWYVYLQAFKNRVCNPRGLKIICNRGSWDFSGAGTHTAFDTMELIDGMNFENYWLVSGAIDWFIHAINGDMYTGLLFIQHIAENNKVIMIGSDSTAAKKAFQATYNGGATDSTVSLTVTNSKLTVVCSPSFADITYNLPDHTLSGLAAQITADRPNITFDYPAGCIWTNANEVEAEILATAAAYNLKTGAKVLTLRTPPRALYVTQAALLALGGANHGQAYTFAYDGGGGHSSSDVPVFTSKLGTVDLEAQGYTHTATDGVAGGHDDLWAEAGGSLAGLQYRVYTNGVAFYNNSGGPLTIPANAAGKPWACSSWYDMGNAANICDVSTVAAGLTSSTSAVLPDKRGTICLFSWS